MAKSLQRKFRSVGRELNFVVVSGLFLLASSIFVAAFGDGPNHEAVRRFDIGLGPHTFSFQLGRETQNRVRWICFRPTGCASGAGATAHNSFR